MDFIFRKYIFKGDDKCPEGQRGENQRVEAVLPDEREVRL